VEAVSSFFFLGERAIGGHYLLHVLRNIIFKRHSKKQKYLIRCSYDVEENAVITVIRFDIMC